MSDIKTALKSNEKQYTELFGYYLKELLTELFKVSNSKRIEKALELYDKIDIRKSALKFYENITVEQQKLLLQRNNSLFDSKFSLIPSIDLNLLWKSLTQESQPLCWTYLTVLYLSSESVNQYSNETRNLTLDDFKGMAPEIDKNSNSLAMMKMMGSMLNMKDFQGKIKNFDKNQIGNIINKCKGMLGVDENDKTIDSIIDNITKEIGNIDLTKTPIDETVRKITSGLSEKNLEEFKSLESKLDITKLMSNIDFSKLALSNVL